MKIIAVDDEKIALEVLEKAIRTTQPTADVHCFQNARQALDFAASTDCEVAFLDIEMREMNGIELAKYLKELNKRINIVFVTGYSQYMGEAFSLHASGYVFKPVTPEMVAKELQNLRNPPVIKPTKRARAQTFGSFEFYIDDEAVRFKHGRTKELIAYLIDRQGASCNTAELCAVLWEGEGDMNSNRSHFRTLISDMSTTLRELDMESLLLRQRNSFAVDVKQIDCDMYRFLQGDTVAINAYAGEYMLQYSWAEMKVGMFGRIG